jgi:outer membrane protein assembly factor BamB
MTSSKHSFNTFWKLVLIFFVALYVLIKFSEPGPSPVYTITLVGKYLKQIWHFKESFEEFTSNQFGTVFAFSVERGRLFAFDAKTGLVKWKLHLSVPKGAIAVFLSDIKNVYIVSSTDVTAYSASSGKTVWETELGSGHVSIRAALADDLMEIFYGDKKFIVDLENGEILSNETFAFYPADPPFRIVNDSIMLTDNSEGLCALVDNPSKLLWCKPEIWLDQIVVDERCELIYAMPDDQTLWMLNLSTGEVVDKISFDRKINETEEEFSTRLYFADDTVIVSFLAAHQTYGLRNSEFCPNLTSNP